ncbi:MAG: GH25 family lysozyme [Myxococcota bacterium]
MRRFAMFTVTAVAAAGCGPADAIGVRQSPPGLGLVDSTPDDDPTGPTDSTDPTDPTTTDGTGTTGGTTGGTSGTTGGTTGTTGGTTGTTGTTGGTTTTTTDGEPPIGVDVSHWQGDIDWADVASNGIGFMVAKASEGTYYTDPTYFDNVEGAWAAGMYGGGYHFAIPDDSSGAEQAQVFVDNGGGWVADGSTLPGVLDIEYNPYGSTCYGLSQSEMEDWIADFVGEYEALTGVSPIVYTNANWWDTCVASSAFSDLPLWVAHYGAITPNLPIGWSAYTIWQYTDAGTASGIAGGCDENLFGGPPSALRALALGQ